MNSKNRAVQRKKQHGQKFATEHKNGLPTTNTYDVESCMPSDKFIGNDVNLKCQIMHAYIIVNC